MALPKIEKIREMTNDDISNEIVKIKRELFDLRLKRATKQSFKSSQFGYMRHRLGQLMTVESERKRQVMNSEGQV